MAKIVKCDICGVVPELMISHSSRMISHRCKDFNSGWHNRAKVVEDWNDSNSQKIEETASSTPTNKAMLQLLSKIKLVVDEYGSCEIKKDDKFYVDVNAVLAQQQHS